MCIGRVDGQVTAVARCSLGGQQLPSVHFQLAAQLISKNFAAVILHSQSISVANCCITADRYSCH